MCVLWVVLIFSQYAVVTPKEDAEARPPWPDATPVCPRLDAPRSARIPFPARVIWEHRNQSLPTQVIYDCSNIDGTQCHCLFVR